MSSRPKLDILVYGATGFTGRLVSKYLSETPGVRWGMAGRSLQKICDLFEEIHEGVNPPQENQGADAAMSSMAADALVSSTRVLLSTAGPFSLYSHLVVEACAKSGTHYVDINGEIPWVKRIIELNGPTAEKTGAIIVPNCGFDSMPSDLGVMLAGHDRALEGHVKFSGEMSGGTIATGIFVHKAYPGEMKDPALIGGTGEPDSFEARPPTENRPYWLAPFGMAPINTRVVRRSAMLRNDQNFSYNEFAVAPSEVVAKKMARNSQVPPEKLQELVNMGKLPKPSQGPSAETRSKSWFELNVVDANDNTVLSTVAGGDPGYDETAKMVTEAALTLAQTPRESLPCKGKGGIWTPSTALGLPLVERLRKAGMTLEKKS